MLSFHWNLFKICFHFVTELLYSFRINICNSFPWVWEKQKFWLLMIKTTFRIQSSVLCMKYSCLILYLGLPFLDCSSILPLHTKPRLWSQTPFMHFSFCKHRGYLLLLVIKYQSHAQNYIEYKIRYCPFLVGSQYLQICCKICLHIV